MTRSLAKLSVELAYILVLQYPDVFLPDLQHRLVAMWGTTLAEYAAFDRVVCAKHLHLLQKSKEPQVRIFFTRDAICQEIS